MLSVNKNPFSWNEGGNISGPTGALTLTTTDGFTIPVENLSNNIEVSAAKVHHLKTTVLSCWELGLYGNKSLPSLKKNRLDVHTLEEYAYEMKTKCDIV